jgi:hypothetical protein
MTYQIWVMEMVTVWLPRQLKCSRSTFPLELPFCLFKNLQQWSAGTYPLTLERRHCLDRPLFDPSQLWTNPVGSYMCPYCTPLPFDFIASRSDSISLLKRFIHFLSVCLQLFGSLKV